MYWLKKAVKTLLDASSLMCGTGVFSIMFVCVLKVADVFFATFLIQSLMTYGTF
jgi:hypothetical protein